MPPAVPFFGLRRPNPIGPDIAKVMKTTSARMTNLLV